MLSESDQYSIGNLINEYDHKYLAVIFTICDRIFENRP